MDTSDWIEKMRYLEEEEEKTRRGNVFESFEKLKRILLKRSDRITFETKSPRNKVGSRARSPNSQEDSSRSPLSFPSSVFHLIRRASTSRGASCCPANGGAHPSPPPPPLSSQRAFSLISRLSLVLPFLFQRMADKTGVRECVSGMMHGGRGTERRWNTGRENEEYERVWWRTSARKRGKEEGGKREREREEGPERHERGQRFRGDEEETSYGNEEMQW